jgi:ABC-2 type transport system ATP-binding protein
MNLITASEVVKDFSGHRALNHVSMEVPEGSIYGLLGPNGAGSSDPMERARPLCSV